ncbi:4605_t:CDS:10 [Funneliformis caledonium]|uniref:4605_t:CDS:1 n=1 Tax=Funneliformis caledonium TaxID=1117310 RepID=A0A9N9H5C5_9GLOM|nr:4605_t:CDS:10 [Funneliformis caledonium]
MTFLDLTLNKRKTTNFNTPQSNHTTVEQSSRSAVLIESLLGRFDSNADFFALVTPGVDRHRMRIFDTHTGKVNNDFFSEAEEKFNCLTWGKLYERDLNGKVVSRMRHVNCGDADTPSPNKKKKPLPKNKQSIKVVALGSQNGTIVIYSTIHGSAIKTLSGSHTSPVNDFVFTKDGKRGYSCGEDMNIVEWDIDNEKVISNWNVDSQMAKFKLALSHDETKILSAGHTIKMWDLQSKQVLKTFTGHATRITNIMFSAKDEICISSAEHDRYINIWKFLDGDNDNGNPAALILDENITDFSISKVNTVLAVSETGILHLFKHTTNSATNDITSPNKKKKRVSTRTADSKIKFLNDDDSGIIPILSACFVDEESKGSGYVMVARGSTVKPIFEKVQFTNTHGDVILQDITLTRHHPTGFLMNESNLAARNLQETQKSYDDSKAKVSGTLNYEIISDNDSENSDNANKDNILNLKDLNIVDVGNTSNQKPEVEQHKFKKLAGHSMQQILVQALHSNDKQLLLTVLRREELDIINNTVKKLPTKYIVPFLEKAIARFQEKPNTGMCILQWIKAVLLFHMAYLMTIPDLTRKLSNFYQTLDARSVSFQKLLNFYGRLDLVMKQVSMRQQVVENNSNKPILSYVEKESDDEPEEVFTNHGLPNGVNEDEDKEMADAYLVYLTPDPPPEKKVGIMKTVQAL